MLAMRRKFSGAAAIHCERYRWRWAALGFAVVFALATDARAEEEGYQCASAASELSWISELTLEPEGKEQDVLLHLASLQTDTEGWIHGSGFALKLPSEITASRQPAFGSVEYWADLTTFVKAEDQLEGARFFANFSKPEGSYETFQATIALLALMPNGHTKVMHWQHGNMIEPLHCRSL